VQITIDNLDSLGALDYSSAIAAEGPITLQRVLNEPSRCTAEIVIGAENRKLPARRARAVVTTRKGAVLFTGYLATEPVRIYAGVASSGPVYRARITAISDEWLLDNLGFGGNAYNATSFNLTGDVLLQRLAQRTQSGTSLLPVNVHGAAQLTGAFTPNTAEPWSENAGNAASAAYASYRAINGQVQVQSIGATTHALSDADGTLSIAELSTNAVRELANDVMLTGAEEPAAYIAENFMGDGTTTVFPLSGPAYRSTQRTMLRDSFNQSAFDITQWAVADPGSHLSLTGAGLTMNGGNGTDGATTVTALDAVEMGGAIVAQLSGVLFNAASDGMMAGFYQGTPQLANCFAGYRVRQNSGVTVIVPVVNGAEVGTVFTPTAGHSYTLRLRLHCPEMQRVLQPYYCMVDGVLKTFGSANGVAGAIDFVFELVDEGAASNTPATVLYDSMASGGTIASSPATGTFVAVNSTQLYGSIASLSLTRPGSMWVLSTLPNGTQSTRLVGIAGQGADCVADYGSETGTPGKITFLTGRVPVAGERVTIFYRGQQRSISRIADAASLASEAAGGAPGTARWLGKVLQPAARSSADCENAVMAVLAMSTSCTAALSGSYRMTNPKQDIWPGDVLAVTSDGVTSSLLVRTVVAKDMGALPEGIVYDIGFANGWAAQWEDGIGVRLSESIATDAHFPVTAATGPAQVLANLPQLRVTSMTDTAITIDAGTEAPTGGGFEVRRKDWLFGNGVDALDLILRSPVRSFSLPRAAQVEQFYVRMYDASSPPLYSRFSSAVVVNQPNS
jgi:hypothetical protein